VTPLLWLLDLVLAASLLVVAWQALASTEPFRAIALFVAFGLLMTLSWVRLDAVDVALAEAGIGAGFTGALFLVGWARLRRQDQHQDQDGSGAGTHR
jgi:energy-converting hydrogenase B subunit D